MVPADVQQRVEGRLRECIAIAEKTYNQKFEMPKVSYNVRGGTAGYAHLSDWAVDFNAILLMENLDTFIHRTVAHEMAHLVDSQLHPGNHYVGAYQRRSLHGASWKRIMLTFGVEPSRCHSYDTTNSRIKRKRQFQYKCTVCGRKIMLGPKRHANEQAVPGTYYHRGCGRRNLELVAPVQYEDRQVAASKPTEKKSTSNAKDTAATIYKTAGSRKEFIEQCVTNGIKKTTASTYYQNFKSGRWS